MNKKSNTLKGFGFICMTLVVLSTVSCRITVDNIQGTRLTIVHELPIDKIIHLHSNVSNRHISNNVALRGAHSYFDDDGNYVDISEKERSKHGNWIMQFIKLLFNLGLYAIGAIFIGIISFFTAIGKLVEYIVKRVKTKTALKEAGMKCVKMENPNTRDVSLEGKLVCATAKATTDETLVDTRFGVQAKAIFLSRQVAYYQYMEISETEEYRLLGINTTTYKYKKEWVDAPVDSIFFADPRYRESNFILFKFDNKQFWAKNVSFGAYTLNDELKSYMTPVPLPIDLDDKILEEWNALVADALKSHHQEQQKGIEVDALNSVSATTGNEEKIQEQKYEFVHQRGNVLYLGKSPDNPSVGDVRITFMQVVPSTVTVVAQVSEDTFIPYTPLVGDSFQKLAMGEKDAEMLVNKDLTE